MKSRKILSVIVSLICVISCVFSVNVISGYAAPQGEATIFRSTQRAYTRPEIIFSTEGSDKKFILLDETEDGFFILSYDMYGARMFDPDNTEKFDITDKNNIAYWLNNDFLKEGNYYKRKTYKMPDAIIRNIVEHDWLTEAGGPHTDFRDDYITRCGVAVLSKTETMKYFNRFGMKDDTSVVTMLLRTSAGAVAQTGGTMLNYILKHATKTGMIRSATASKNGGLRPAFYLDKDFFIKERIDITTAGDDIRKLIKSRYSKTQLKKLYSEAEINKLTSALPPQALNVRVVGHPVVGEVLKCTYDYYAPDGQSENGTKIQWIRYEQGSTNPSIIPGADSSEYIPTAEDVGKGISAKVIPACENKTGRVTEAEFYRDDILEITDVSDIYIDELALRGRFAPGGMVYADYKYYHPTYFIEKGTSYLWQGGNDTASFEVISSMGNERQAKIPQDIQYKYIRCVVTLADGKEYISDAYEADAYEKSEEVKFVSFPVRDCESVSCVSGQSYCMGGGILNIADAVSFIADKGTSVSAEGCEVHSLALSDRIYYTVTKNEGTEKMVIDIKTEYDGNLNITDITIAKKR